MNHAFLCKVRPEQQCPPACAPGPPLGCSKVLCKSIGREIYICATSDGGETSLISPRHLQE
eukprot:85650-Lingulodinium_polyedra.AAC.1